MKIEDKYKLLALHRALMEARFCERPNDPSVAASPILAELHRELVSEICSQSPPAGGSVDEWRDWLILTPERREWVVAVNNLRNSSWWPKLEGEKKTKAVLDALSPFSISLDFVEEFTHQVDSGR